MPQTYANPSIEPDPSLSQALCDAFGVRAEETGSVIAQYITLAYSVGYPHGSGKGVGDWLAESGFDSINFWRTAVERVRAGNFSLSH